VNGAHGSDKNDCASPRHACRTITRAIALSSGGDSILVAAAVYRENLTIRHSLKIVGSGQAATVIDGQRIASEIVTSGHGVDVTISGLTLRNGGGPGDGGGIYNCQGKLTIIDSTVTGNTAIRGAGALGYGGGTYNCPGGTLTIIDSTYRGNTAVNGGAICNGGTLTIIGSTFSGTTARQHRGGAIFNYGTLTISNSTFSGNGAPGGAGGAIANGQLFRQTGALLISSSTIIGNRAGPGKGGGIFSRRGVPATIQDSIVAGNAGGNCRGALTSDGYNLSSDGTCSFTGPGDANNTDPRLGPLRDNGGPTQTMALLRGSPAVDAGNPAGCTDGHGHLLATDQRGAPRPDRGDTGGCDKGAYERQGG
jgi:hypothetical protein